MSAVTVLSVNLKKAFMGFQLMSNKAWKFCSFVLLCLRLAKFLGLYYYSLYE
jgi:hypothetical protein